jgi:L-ascorbate metabolism protein UlaG (beta-lactamase superfamily)
MKFLSSLLTLLLFTFITANAQYSSTPDTYETGEGELTVHPINHGSIVFTFNDQTILVDPFGGAELFASYGAPDLIFITDIHGDHLHSETLSGLDLSETTIVAPQAVADRLEQQPAELIVIGNGDSAIAGGLAISAIPMYNLPGDETVRHVKGRGNGYIIEFGDKTVYVSGDTEDIPEMRALEGIDIAFVCMNLPYTMDVQQASSAVIEFQPTVVYPYHHRGQDIEQFKSLVDFADVNIDVRLKDWYPN